MLDIQINVNDFLSAANKNSQIMNLKTEQGIKELAFFAKEKIMAITPVDTGRCRAGWRMNQETPLSWIIDNPVEYTIYLEYGHSKQAPAGMVRITAQEIKNMITSGIIKI